jgi:hypothetical protein
MKFAAVFFDWGDTLSVVSKKSDALVVKTNDWIASMIHRLYQDSYRLAIISNTHRYQDAWWIRNELAKVNCLSILRRENPYFSIEDQTEYLVLERSKEFNKEDVLKHTDDFVEFKVKKL